MLLVDVVDFEMVLGDVADFEMVLEDVVDFEMVVDDVVDFEMVVGLLHGLHGYHLVAQGGLLDFQLLGVPAVGALGERPGDLHFDVWELGGWLEDDQPEVAAVEQELPHFALQVGEVEEVEGG